MKPKNKAIDILKQGDTSCFGSHRDAMRAIYDEWFKVKKYCDQFPDSAYHKAFIEGCERRLNDKIHGIVSMKVLVEKGCL